MNIKEAELQRYIFLTEEIKKLKKEYEELKKIIFKEYGSEQSYLKEDMGFIVELKLIEKNIIDSKTLKEKFPDIYNKFSKKSISKNLSIKKIGVYNNEY